MVGRRRPPATVRSVLACLGLWVVGAPAAAQESPRVPIVVDYVGVEGIYLPIGTAQGLQIGDSLPVFATDSAAVPLGVLVFTAAARSRSVAAMLDPAFDLARGDAIYAWLPTVTVAAEPAQGPAAPVPEAVRQPAREALAQGGPRVSGRISLDVEARETRTSWEGDLFGTTRRRFATPVSNVSLRVADLPGGFRVEMNLRGSYRYSDGVAIQPAQSLRVYNFSAIKVFESAPLELRLGRFYNPHEAYSSYWDGALVRVGGRSGPGIGVVAGFDPERSNESVSQDVAKITGFVDFSTRGGSWRYDTDVSFHFLRPQVDGLPDRSFAGWSQQLSVGRLALNQRLRFDRDPGTGVWSLSQLRLRTGISLVGALRLNLGYGRTRPAALRGASLALSNPERDEMTAGLSLFGGRSSLRFDVGSTQWTDEERGISLSGSASSQVGGLRLYASGRHWSRAGMTSISAAPGVGFDVGWLATRLGYQYYRTDSSVTLTSQSGSVDFTARPGQGLWLSLRAEQQWGGNFGGTRLRLTIGRSF